MRFIYEIKIENKVVDGTHYDTIKSLRKVNEEEVTNVKFVEAATSIFIYEKEKDSFDSIMAIQDTDIVDSKLFMEFKKELPIEFIGAFNDKKLFVSLT